MIRVVVGAACLLWALSTAAQDQAGTDLGARRLSNLKVTVTPSKDAKTGQLVTVTLTAVAHKADRLAVTETRFAPFEVHSKHHRTTPKGQQRTHTFVFNLLPLAPGEFQIPAIEIQVVTPSGQVGSVQTSARSVRVKSWLANEPNAKLKGVDKSEQSKPVSVWQDDFTLLWIGGGLLAVLLISLLTWLTLRWWQAHRPRATPIAPPRPAWEIATGKLQRLWMDRDELLDTGRGVEFVDRLSDIAREYLGLRYGFEGLESTTDEVLARLRRLRPARLSLEALALTLSECDLIKFAKVDAQRPRAEELFKETERLIELTTPQVQPRELQGARPHE